MATRTERVIDAYLRKTRENEAKHHAHMAYLAKELNFSSKSGLLSYLSTNPDLQRLSEVNARFYELLASDQIDWMKYYSGVAKI